GHPQVRHRRRPPGGPGRRARHGRRRTYRAFRPSRQGVAGESLGDLVRPLRRRDAGARCIAGSPGGADFEVMAISSDRDGAEAVRPFMERYGIRHLAVYLDPRGEATRGFEARGLPTSLLIDRDGRIVGRLEGPADWNSEDARNLIRHYLHQPA